MSIHTLIYMWPLRTLLNSQVRELLDIMERNLEFTVRRVARLHVHQICPVSPKPRPNILYIARNARLFRTM